MNICSRCGSEHRTHPGFYVDGSWVGAPCLVDARARIHALETERSGDPAYQSIREVLGENDESVQRYAAALDSRPEEELTEEQAEHLRLLRFSYVHEEHVLVLHDLIAAALLFDATPSQEGSWLGEEKERVTRRVRVLRINGPYVGEYGDSWLCVMETTDTQDLCIWWTGDNLSFDEGEEYNIRGTVKKQDHYNGRCQTVLTRVKEVQSESAS